MIVGLLGKLGSTFALNTLKKNAGPIILFVVLTAGFTYAAWKYHSLYVMAMDTKVELTEVKGELDQALAERAQYLSTIDQQNEGLKSLKERTQELKQKIERSRARVEEYKKRNQDAISEIEDLEIKDQSCEGVVKWMATEAEKAATW